MTRSVTFETAALADAVNSANRVAPTKGAAYDRAAGLLFQLRPDDEKQVTVKATNLEVTFLRWVEPIHIEGDPGDWRVPSALLAGILAGLPQGASQTVTMAEKDGEKNCLFITSAKIKAKIRVMPNPEDFIVWFPFDEDELVNVPGFTARVAQASWACDRQTPPYSGVHINGSSIIATDRYKLTRVPCVVPVAEPITAPLDVIAPLVKNLTDARLQATETQLRLMLDTHTQITSQIYAGKYPDVGQIMDATMSDHLTVDRDPLIEAIQRMLVLTKSERYPILRLTIGNGMIEVHMNVPEVGEMDDEVPVAEGAAHAPFVSYFTPQTILDGMAHAAAAKVTFDYSAVNPRAIVRISDGLGYQAWIVPRRVSSGEAV